MDRGSCDVDSEDKRAVVEICVILCIGDRGVAKVGIRGWGRCVWVFGWQGCEFSCVAPGYWGHRYWQRRGRL
jgi:hypothetical protein